MPITYIGTVNRNGIKIQFHWIPFLFLSVNLTFFMQIKPRHIIKQCSENGTESWIYIKQLRHSKREIAQIHRHICIETFLLRDKKRRTDLHFNSQNDFTFGKFDESPGSFYLLHRRLSMVTFNFFWNISSICSIFCIMLTVFCWMRVDATTRKQNAQKPENRLYESIKWRTIFFVPSAALISLFDIQIWKML